jgi:ATP-dependent Clp protease ATP-binding subunit ClpA
MKISPLIDCHCSGSIKAVPPLIGRRAEMLKIAQILLQSWKNNLILVGYLSENVDCGGL